MSGLPTDPDGLKAQGFTHKVGGLRNLIAIFTCTIRKGDIDLTLISRVSHEGNIILLETSDRKYELRGNRYAHQFIFHLTERIWCSLSEVERAVEELGFAVLAAIQSKLLALEVDSFHIPSIHPFTRSCSVCKLVKVTSIVR